MKCEVCRELLEEYLDGELALPDSEQVDGIYFAALSARKALQS
jgi:predicted anti-sigma-YlaC factor YlaD